jgi:hypothetical protein
MLARTAPRMAEGPRELLGTDSLAENAVSTPRGLALSGR